MRADRLMGLRVAKTGLAAALAWLVSARLFADSLPVLAPLAALLTVQVTIYRSVTVGLQRAAAVIAGVLLALLVAHAFGLHAWSIGVVTAAAMLLGQALRLGQQAVQVPVSALLVLALSAQSQLYPRDRVLETLLGGAIGVAVNLVVVPPLFTRTADMRLGELGSTIAALLDDVAAGLSRRWDHATAREWLMRARRLHQDLDAAREALAQAEESVRYNPRRLAQTAETAHFQAALTALEHTAFQVRGITRSLTDLAAADPAAAAALGPAIASVFGAEAQAMRAFGEAIGGDSSAAVDRLRDALARARGRQAEAAVAAAVIDPGSPAWTIRGSLLADAARMLRELDPDSGPHAEAVASR
jgi:uncharacterized membrane protein YgaE (UPF0421/DUF939 family)